MTAASLAVRLVDHALAELAERAERMTDEQLMAEARAIASGGRSAAGDLVVAVLDREQQRRQREASHE